MDRAVDRARAERLASRVAALALPVALAGCYAGGDETGTSVEAVHRVCATETTVRGVDVSIYQGTIDWPAAARGGIDFAIIRHSHGATNDTNFVRNWNGARAAGILHGAYQYFDPWMDPARQANSIVDGLMAVGYGPGDLPPTLDVEEPRGPGDPPLPSPADYTARVRTWVNVIRTRLGVDPMIYTGGYYWDSYVRSDEFARLPLWHAQYFNYPGTIYRVDVTPLPGMSCPTSVSNAWPRWTFWQFAGGNGRAPGFSGAVDCNVFNGTMAQLRALARGPVPDAGAGDAMARADAAAGDAAGDPDAQGADDAGGLDAHTNNDAAFDARPEPADARASDGASARDDARAQPGCACRAGSPPRGPRHGPALAACALAGLAGSLRRHRARRRGPRFHAPVTHRP